MTPEQRLTATLDKLTSINETLKLILRALVNGSNGNTAPAVDERIIAGPHGDPLIKAKDPRDWSGDPMTGKHFSECPPEYLDLLAERYDYFASKNDDEAATAKRVNDVPVVAEMEKKARYAKLDASRARAWAAKLRAGYVPPSTGAPAVSEAGREPTW